MKKIKKAIALVLASVMTLALAAPVWADDPTANAVVNVAKSDGSDSNAVFDGYQLMTMTSALKEQDCHSSGKHTLSCYNISYSVNDKYAEVMVAAAADASVKNSQWDSKTAVTASNLVDYLSVMPAAEAQAFANVVYAKLAADTATYTPDVKDIGKDGKEVAQGWWLFVDTRNTTDLNKENESRSLVLLQTHGQDAITISPKTDAPSIDKEIVEGESTTDHISAGIGDTVTFRLTADDLPSPTRLESYKTYKCEFYDTLSQGLSYVEDSVKVYVDSEENTLTKGTDYTISSTVNTDKTTKLEIKISDMKKLSDWKENSKLIVEYSAVITADAEIGNPGNKNEAVLKYSNDPYNSDSGDPAEGETPPDDVVVFTFEVDGTKVEADKNDVKLAGAKFVLYREIGTDKEYAEFADGKLEKWTTLDAVMEKESTNTFKENRVLTSAAATGKFEIKGLEEGTYYLLEIEAPAGYNLLKDVLKLVVQAEYTDKDTDGNPQVSKLTVTVTEGAQGTQSTTATGDNSTGIVDITVENSTGTQLPDTGGMGTTLIYLAGGILVVGALILLVLRKRRSEEE